MHRRIQELARGQFNHSMPALELSTDKLEIHVLEGQKYTGEFVIKSVNHIPMKGKVYVSNPRMECMNPQFEGEEVRIRFEFHSEGLDEGNIQKGDFYIICNGGEYNLSFVIFIYKKYADTSAGQIRTLHDFAVLAEQDWEEACQLFRSSYFKNIFTKEEKRELLLYQGLVRGKNANFAMEQFLVGIHKKQVVHFQVEEGSREFLNLNENIQEMLSLRKDNWGFLWMEAKSDAEFLRLEKNLYTTEDFVGSVCQIPFLLLQDRLHAGKNYARVTFSNLREKNTVEFCVEQGTSKEKQQLRREIQEGKIRLTELYTAYRLKKIVTGVWCSESVKVLDHMRGLEPENAWYALIKAQALLINRQRQESEWILDEFRRNCKDKMSEEWAYYLYLCTLNERESSYVNKLTREIEEIYRHHQESVRIFWMLLFLREEYYHNQGRKLRDIENIVSAGNFSPFLYVEAYYLLVQEPYLLHSLGEFQIHILRWAARRGSLTREIVSQMMELMGREDQFRKSLYEILTVAYEKYPQPELAEIICKYLIKFAKFQPEYFKWYALGVEEELRITNLYEAYMMSIDQRSVIKLPKVIQMYFQYNSTLTYQRKAILYVSILANREQEPVVFQNYRPAMEQFVLKQMELKRMDDNLSVLYEYFLEQGMLNREIAQQAADFLYTHKFTCLREDVQYVIVLQRQLRKVQVVPLVNHVAYFSLYTNDYCILMEDAVGRRFQSSEECQLEKLLHPMHFVRKCMELVPEKIPYLLHYFEHQALHKAFQEERMEQLEFLAQSELVSPAYKQELYSEILSYSYEHETYHMMETVLQREDFLLLRQNIRVMAVEILVELHLYEKAYELIAYSGIEFIQTRRMLPLCSYMVQTKELEEDELLLSMCARVFFYGKYNDVILQYLCVYYEGPTKQMAILWRAAKQFEINTFDLEERLLTQMLYTTEFVENVDEIFAHYCRSGGRTQLREAYQSYYAYSYFVQGMVVPSTLFEDMSRQAAEQELNDVCKLALLQYFSQKDTLSVKEEQMAEKFLGEFIGENMYFAFYKKLPAGLVRKYHLYDKVFVEYRTMPGRRVQLFYRGDSSVEDYKKEEMQDTFEGIYVHRFSLFFGEKIQYYVTEEVDGQVDITESNTIQNNDIYNENDGSRYDLLNGMVMSETLEDHETLLRLMREYKRRELMTETLFQLK